MSEQNIRPRGRVFLSYGHDEACTGLVDRIKADLEARGWEPWVDKHRIDFGDDWRREITKGIRESQHVLAFLSKHSTRKPGVCRQEVAIALGPLRGHVYTVLVEPLSEVTPPLILSRLQWLDMQQWQTLKDSNPAEYGSMYGQCLEQILSVLERNQPFAGEIDELHRWLQPLDGTADMVDAENGFTGREWLLDGIGNTPSDAGPSASAPSEVGEIEAWRTAGSSNRVFWLAAQPGWGKSSVAARLAHVGRTKVLAVHFCKHDRPNTRDARQVVRTLAFQMATQLGDYRQLLLAEAARNTALGEMNAQELFHALLANPLTHVLQGADNTRDLHLMVLDALDETLDERGRSDLLNLVATDFQRLPAWIGLVVTSRPEAPIVRQLRKFGVHQLAAEDPRNLEDLRKYVAAWLESLGSKIKSVDKAMSALMDASAGNFLYIRQLREAVADGVLATDSLLEAGQLPKGLSSLYEQWFLRRFPNADYYDEKLRPLLELMLAAREPLPLALVAAVLQWDTYGPRALEKLGTLCVVENGTARLFHKSLSDWLEDPEVCGWEFHADVKQGHLTLAERMREAYLNERDKPTASSEEPRWAEFDAKAVQYALTHLPAHLGLAGRQEDRRILLQDFMFAMWRCAAGAHEAMMDDHFRVDSIPASPELREWKDMLNAEGHLLRRGQSWWRPHRLLLQIATERPPASVLRKSADDWRQTNHERWPWLQREGLSADQKSRKRSVTDFGQGRAFNVRIVDVWWPGPHAAVASSVGEVLVFDLKSGRQIHRFESVGTCSSIRLEGDVLECFHPDGTISRRSLSSGVNANKSVADTFITHESGEQKLIRTSRNGRWRIMWDGQNTLQVQAVDQSVPSWSLQLPENAPVKSITVTDDGTQFAAGCSDGKVWYSPGPTNAPRCLHDGAQEIYGIDITPDGQWIATVGKDRMLRVWDVLDEQLWFSEAADGFLAKRVCLAPDGRQAVTAGLDGKLLRWDLSSKSVRSTRGLVTTLVEVPEGTHEASQWVAADEEGQLHCYSEQGKDSPENVSWQAHKSKIWDLAITPDGQHLATAGADGIGRVWHRETRAHLADIVSVRQKPFRAVAISPEGRWLVVAGEDKRPQVHDLHAVLQNQTPGAGPLNLEAAVTLHCRSAIEKLLFVDNLHFLSADTTGLVRMWRVDTPDPLWAIDHGSACEQSVGQPQHGARGRGAYALAVSKSGRLLACSGTGPHRGISLWRLGAPLSAAPPTLVHVLHGHERGVHFLAFRDDDRHLVSASWDETIVMWDWRRRERCLLRLVAQLSAVLAMRDDERLAVGTAFGDQFTLRFQNLSGPERS